MHEHSARSGRFARTLRRRRTRQDSARSDRAKEALYASTKNRVKLSMADLTVDALFDAAVRIQLLERSIVVTFDADQMIHIKFPITRRLAEFLGIPHYLILRSFARLEEEHLVTKAERAGIITTKKGSQKMIRLMQEKYLVETGGILGAEIFEELCKKAA